MAGPIPAIHAPRSRCRKLRRSRSVRSAWMAGPRPAMTSKIESLVLVPCAVAAAVGRLAAGRGLPARGLRLLLALTALRLPRALAARRLGGGAGGRREGMVGDDREREAGQLLDRAQVGALVGGAEGD